MAAPSKRSTENPLKLLHLILAILLLVPAAFAIPPHSTNSASSQVHQETGAQPSPTTPASPASFDYNRESLVSLDGHWRFHPGDDPDGQLGWASPAFDDSSWPLLATDKPWSDQGYPGMSGFGWYRFSVQAPGTHPTLALELAPMMTSYQIFVGGHLAGAVGKMPPNLFPTADWNYQVIPLAEAATGQAPHRFQIAIRVWNSPIWAGYIGGGPSTDITGNLIGVSNKIAIENAHHKDHRRLLFVDRFAYSIVSFIVGITIFGLFLFRPQEREYLWFAILLVSKGVDATLTVIFQVYAFPPVPVFDIFDGSLVACAQIAFVLFLTRVLKARKNFLWYAILITALVSPIFNVAYWPGWLSAGAGGMIQIFCLLPSAIWMLAILGAAALKRNVNARLLLLPVVLVQGLWITDNVIIVLNQYGVPIEARIIETPLVVAPFTMHPSLLAELLFLLAMLAFLIRRFTIARRREERWEGALEAARQVQNLLLPEAIPQIEGFAIDCIYRPADVVGGDFFQILPVPGQEAGGDLLIVVGDVAGKGLPAAMMVSMIVGVIRAEAAHSTDPGHLISALNDRMTGRSGNELGSGFTTCLCAHLSASGRLVLANAGHLPPYRNGVELPMPGALPLGMLTGVTYELITAQLKPGDRLTFVSDGVVEAQSRSGELLGFARTEELSTKSAAEIAEIASSFGQVDDITVVTIEFLGAAASAHSDSAAKAASI